MKERADVRIQVDPSSPDTRSRNSEPARDRSLVVALPRAGSPLQGRRVLMSLPAFPEGADMLAQDHVFEDRIALAAHLASEGMDVHVVAIGAPASPSDVHAIGLTPGVTLSPAGWAPSPDEDAGACASALAQTAARLGADLVLLHEPALAAARRDARPTIVTCDSSSALRWRRLGGGLPSPALTARLELERLGLHAADRVLTSSRVMSEALARTFHLATPPAVVPPVFRAPLLRERAGDEAGVILAGASRPDPLEALALDRAASLVCGTVLLLAASGCDPAQALCFETLHKLAPMPSSAAEGLAARAAAFYCPSTGPEFDPLIWRAAGAGCALILPDVPAHREFWQGAAHFVPQNCDHSLAAAMRRMFEDIDFRRAQAHAALRRAHALSRGAARETLRRTLTGALASRPTAAAV